MEETVLTTIDGIGKVIGYGSPDPTFPGAEMELVLDKDNGALSNPRVRLELADGRLQVLVWGDKNSEDYSHRITINL